MMPTDLAGRRPKASHGRRGVDAMQFGAAEIAAIVGGKVLRKGEGACDGFFTDSRQPVAGAAFVALRGERLDGHDFVADVMRHGATGAIIDRDLPRRLLPKGPFLVRTAATGRALLDLAAEWRRRSAAKIVGVTGSCGKTSTKDMLRHVFARHRRTVSSPKSFNNHVGVPLTLFQLRPDCDVGIVEIGSSAPGEIANLARVVAPEIAIITNVAHSHLQGLGSLDGVAREKASILASVRAGGTAILNGDDASCEAMAADFAGRVVRVRVDSEADWFATDVTFHGLGTSFRLQGEIPVTLPRLGSHNVYNALFTIAAATDLGLELDVVLTALCDLPATSRRLECKNCNGVTLIDDTYNSNPGSARAALRALAGLHVDGRRVVVFGEMLELGDCAAAMHNELGAEVVRAGVDLLVTVGSGCRPVGAGAVAAGMAGNRVRHCVDPAACLTLLMGELRTGDMVLCKASRRIGLDRVVDGLLARHHASN